MRNASMQGVSTKPGTVGRVPSMPRNETTLLSGTEPSIPTRTGGRCSQEFACFRIRRISGMMARNTMVMIRNTVKKFSTDACRCNYAIEHRHGLASRGYGTCAMPHQHRLSLAQVAGAYSPIAQLGLQVHKQKTRALHGRRRAALESTPVQMLRGRLLVTADQDASHCPHFLEAHKLGGVTIALKKLPRNKRQPSASNSAILR